MRRFSYFCYALDRWLAAGMMVKKERAPRFFKYITIFKYRQFLLLIKEFLFQTS